MAKVRRPVAKPGVVLREEFDEGAILYDADGGQGFGINPTGAFIWKLIDGKNTAESIWRKMSEKIEALPPDARGHLEDFLQDLGVRGLVGSVLREEDEDREDSFVPRDRPQRPNRG